MDYDWIMVEPFWSSAEFCCWSEYLMLVVSRNDIFFSLPKRVDALTAFASLLFWLEWALPALEAAKGCAWG